MSAARREFETALDIGSFTFSASDLFPWGEGVTRVSALLAFDACLLLLGDLGRAGAVAREGAAGMRTVVQPYSRAILLGLTYRIHAIRRDARRLIETASMYANLTDEQRYRHFGAQSMVFHGWALAFNGEAARGLELASAGVARCRAIGFSCWLSLFLTMLAECHVQAGDPQSALQCLAEAAAPVESTGERFLEAELHRLQGEIGLAAGGEPRDTEDCFARALDVARSQEARLLELRAATSLTRLRQNQSRQAEAQNVLTPIYRRFTDGFELPDLRAAKAALMPR